MWTNQHQEPIERRHGKTHKAKFIEKGGYAREKEIRKGPGKAKSKQPKKARAVQA